MWTHGEENRDSFMRDFDNFKSSLKIAFECDRSSINFLDLSVKLNNDELTTSFYIKPTDRHHYLHNLIQTILNGQLFIVKTVQQVVYVHLKKTL